MDKNARQPGIAWQCRAQVRIETLGECRTEIGGGIRPDEGDSKRFGGWIAAGDIRCGRVA